MQTHMNDDAIEFVRSLQSKAARMTEDGKSTIAGGAPNESPICEWHANNNVFCRKMPDDEHGILRISVGGGDSTPVQLNYCIVRGGVGHCIALLEKAIAALRECPE